MKHFLKSHLMCISVIVLFFACMLGSKQAEAKTYDLMSNHYGGSCSVVIEKGKVYYSVTETGCIYCYNIKTKKTTTIIKTKGKGFTNLKKKGNYLYAVYDSYSGSDGTDNAIVRVSIKSGKKTKLAKGCNFVISGKKIYFTKTKRVKDSYMGYDEIIGVYSMTLAGKKQKPANNVVLERKRTDQDPIKTSKGTLFTKGEVKNNYYRSKSLHFKSKKGKTVKIYDVTKSNYPYGGLYFFTVQGDYIVYKKMVQEGVYVKGQLVLVKTNGKGSRVIYSRDSVSGW